MTSFAFIDDVTSSLSRRQRPLKTYVSAGRVKARRGGGAEGWGLGVGLGVGSGGGGGRVVHVIDLAT